MTVAAVRVSCTAGEFQHGFQMTGTHLLKLLPDIVKALALHQRCRGEEDAKEGGGGDALIEAHFGCDASKTLCGNALQDLAQPDSSDGGEDETTVGEGERGEGEESGWSPLTVSGRSRNAPRAVCREGNRNTHPYVARRAVRITSCLRPRFSMTCCAITSPLQEKVNE